MQVVFEQRRHENQEQVGMPMRGKVQLKLRFNGQEHCRQGYEDVRVNEEANGFQWDIGLRGFSSFDQFVSDI